MNCKIFEDKIWDYLDGSLADNVRQDCQSHLTDCSKCSAELEASKAILSEARSIEKAKAPDLLWQRIEAELDAPRVPFYSAIRDPMVKLMTIFENLLATPAPALKIAGVLAILTIGVFVGRHLFPSRTPDRMAEQLMTQNPKVQMVANRTNDFVEKSKILFLGFVNADPADAEESDWTTEKRVAQNLVRKAAVLKDDLAEFRNERLRLLIEELEIILLEISNLEETYDMENVDLIKSGIDHKGLMLKIHLHDLADNSLEQQKSESKNRPDGKI